ncbi:RDD family protein [Bryocella elongata]|uniref:RDD family protein n=1 Tax=Bryocella elongata TaxID=863522 RepID=A0A1H6B1Q5_9BACT|nr:RDD family protein [Bryocella elongata]SEG54534.1 RDD family protein [Bryocella elongata]
MRRFSAKETEWLLELDGIELANFWPRAFAFVIDWMIVGILLSTVATAGFATWLGIRHLQGKPTPDFMQMATESSGKLHTTVEKADAKQGFHFNIGPGKSPNGEEAHGPLEQALEVVNDIVVPVLYFGVLLWKGHGRTPGKRLMNIRVMSIAHRHLSFWHSVERALGYGAAALEGGFGFVQFFLHPYRRCAQDRLAETIVVTERSYQDLQHRLSHPLIPDEK